jgi:hypothetical protein
VVGFILQVEIGGAVGNRRLIAYVGSARIVPSDGRASQLTARSEEVGRMTRLHGDMEGSGNLRVVLRPLAVVLPAW